MRFLFILFFPMAAFANQFPLFDNSLRLYFDPVSLNLDFPKAVDSVSVIETFYKTKIFYLRAQIQSPAFHNYDLTYMVGGGFLVQNHWLIGANISAYSVETGKFLPLKFRFGPQLTYHDELFKAYFSAFFGGDFMWGAALMQTLFIPVEFVINFERGKRDSLELRLKFGIMETIATKVEYDLLLNSVGFGMNIYASKIFSISLDVRHNFLIKNEFSFGLGFLLLFKTGEPDSSHEQVNKSGIRT